MIKYTSWDLVDKDGSYFQPIDVNHGLVKTAEYTTELKRFVDTLKPKPGKTYVLVNAMGASEFYGQNRNGDIFYEDSLKQYYKTFEEYGHAFKHHKNSDPTASYGKVVFATYNENMHRVELVIELDNDRAADILYRIDNGDYPKVSMGCFLPGTPVVTNSFTTVSIENIKIGDTVLTHSGQLQKVVELHPRKYSGLVYKIYPKGKFNSPIIATREHPWLIIDEKIFYTKDQKSRKIRNKNLTLKDAYWEISSKLTTSDYLVIPRPKNPYEIFVSNKKAKMLGWYLAEGWTYKKRNSIVFATHKSDQLIREWDSTINYYEYSSFKVRQHPKSDFGRILEVHGAPILKDECIKYCGTLSSKKHLNKEIFYWNREAKLNFLAAYISGDGFFHANNIYISSCNKILLTQIQWLARSLGLSASIGKNEHSGGKGFSNTDTTEWVLRFKRSANKILGPYCNKIYSSKDIKTCGNGYYEYEDFLLVPIDKIESFHYDGMVHNFEVEGDNSYVVDQYAAHNCKTPKDVCSICGNTAARRADYCDHLKYEMGNIYSDGRQVGAINKYPLKFFDISFVMIPADAIAGTMAKLANYGAKIPSVIVAEELLKNSGIKESQLIKEIEGDIQAVNDDPKRLIYDSQPDLPNDELAQVLSKYSLRDILSTLLGLRIVPKPEEFQRIVLIKANRPDIAEACDRNKVLLMHPDEQPRISPDISLDYFNDELARAIAHWVPERALTKPAIIKRVLLKRAALDSAPLPVGVQNILDNVRKIKQRRPKGPVLKEPQQSLYKPTKNPAVPLLGMGSLYLGYHKLMDALHKTAPGLISARNLGGLEKHLLKKPWLLPLLLGGVAAGTAGLQEHLFKEAAMVNPTFLKSMMVSVPASYIYGGYAEHKLRQGQPITKFQDFVRRHPFLTGMAGTVGLRRLAKGIVKTSALDSLDDIIYGLDPVKLDEFYADVIDAR